MITLVLFQSAAAALQDSEDGLGSQGHAGYPTGNLRLRVRTGLHQINCFTAYSKLSRSANTPHLSTGMSERSSRMQRPIKERMTLSSSPSTIRWLTRFNECWTAAVGCYETWLHESVNLSLCAVRGEHAVSIRARTQRTRVKLPLLSCNQILVFTVYFCPTENGNIEAGFSWTLMDFNLNLLFDQE